MTAAATTFAPHPRHGTPESVIIRSQALPSDVAAVRDIARSTAFFTPAEIDIAIELLEDRLQDGEGSEYQFLFADLHQRPLAFASYGKIACTIDSWDLYWIAVHDDYRGGGLGRRLLSEVENAIMQRAQHGPRIYVETSSRPQYHPTLQFYRRCGFRIEAVLEDFYAPGDGKVILVKSLA